MRKNKNIYIHKSERIVINQVSEWIAEGHSGDHVQSLLNGMGIKAIQVRPIYALSHPPSFCTHNQISPKPPPNIHHAQLSYLFFFHL